MSDTRMSVMQYVILINFYDTRVSRTENSKIHFW